jgi:hypothetical protein
MAQGNAGYTPPSEVLCPNCKGGNPHGEQTCRWCRAPLGNFQSYSTNPPQAATPTANLNAPRKRSLSIPIILALIGLCLMVAVIGSTMRSADSPTVPQQTAAQNPSATNLVEAPAAVADTPVPTIRDTVAPLAELTIGSTGEIDGLKITLNEIRHEQGTIFKPDPGNEYLVLNITIENTDAEPENVSSMLSFTVKDDTGQRYSESFTADVAKGPTGAIAPGDKVRGDTAYEVPLESKGLYWIFTPAFSSEQLLFKLDR